MPATGLVYDEIYLKHDTGPHHPERAQRLTAIFEALEVAGLLDKLMLIKPAPADRSVLALCHEPTYIDMLENAVNSAISYLHTPECPLCPYTFEVALCAAGGVLKGVDAVMEESVQTHIQVLMEMEVF